MQENRHGDQPISLLCVLRMWWVNLKMKQPQILGHQSWLRRKGSWVDDSWGVIRDTSQNNTDPNGSLTAIAEGSLPVQMERLVMC